MIKTFDFGCLSSNTYVVSDGGEAMIIDAGVECAPIAEYIRSNSLAVKYIVLTHGHYDHICYIRDYIDEFPEATVVYHRDEHRVLCDYEANLSLWICGRAINYNLPHLEVSEGEVLEIGTLSLEIIHTPGHTPGGICLLCRGEGVIFTGDTRFENGFGRTDFKYGSIEGLEGSLARIEANYKGYKVLAGHNY